MKTLVAEQQVYDIVTDHVPSKWFYKNWEPIFKRHLWENYKLDILDILHT